MNDAPHNSDAFFNRFWGISESQANQLLKTYLDNMALRKPGNAGPETSATPAKENT